MLRRITALEVSLGFCALALLWIFSAVPVQAGTPDGETPAEEDVCDGLEGAAYGLCVAFCEAQDCDEFPKDSCERLRKNYEKKTGSPVFPCENKVPVFEVLKKGLTIGEAEAIAGGLGLPPDQLQLVDGAAYYVDPLTYQAAPMIPLGDQLPPDEDQQPVVAEAFDFQALLDMTPLAGEVAMQMFHGALAQADLLPEATAAFEHTMLEIVDLEGTPLVNALLDTRVTYAFELYGKPLIGPGAKIQASYSPQGMVTAFAHSVYELQHGEYVDIISPADAVEQCAALYEGFDVVATPKLVYYAPPLGPGEVTEILPHYDCSATGPDGIVMLNRLLPALEIPELVPQVDLQVLVDDGLVIAQAIVEGGKGPYSYSWLSSTTDLSWIPEDSSLAEYFVVGRVDAGPIGLQVGETLTETLKVEVLDANGALDFDSDTFEVDFDLPDKRAGAGPVKTASPTGQDVVTDLEEGGSSGQAPRVGGVTDFGIERAVSDLCGTTVNRYSSRMDDEAFKRFHWTGQTAWERDFKHAASDSGTDHHTYVDNVDQTFYCGHGGGGGFAFETSMDDGSLSYTDPRQSAGGDWGDKDLEWLALLSCQVLTETSGGLNWAQRWGPAFDGLHLLMGFETNAYPWNDFGKAFADYQQDWILGITLPVRVAWFQAAALHQPSGSKSVVMGVLGPDGLANFNDYFWGNGPVGPDIRGENIYGYWRQTQVTP